MKKEYGTIYTEGQYVVFEHKSKGNKFRKRWNTKKNGGKAQELAAQYKATYSQKLFEENYPDLKCARCNYSTKNRVYYKTHCKGKRHKARLELQQAREKDEEPDHPPGDKGMDKSEPREANPGVEVSVSRGRVG